MCDEFITAKHVEKLSHHIPEIRERALLNIHSKLQRGIYYDNDLARSKELFWQLCNWFRENNAPIRHDQIVTKMLRSIIKSETGIYLIDLHSAPELIKEFNVLKSIVEEDSQCHLIEIIKYLEDVASAVKHPMVPPLNLNELNSYRSGSCDTLSIMKDDVGTTATTIAGFIDSFVSLDLADNNNYNKPRAKPQRKTTEQNGNVENPFRHYTFLWQWLIGADRHVLESVETTLRSPSEPSELLNSFEFITDVLLNDFPAEVFLQRPAIVKLLHDLLWSSPSSRITTCILKCLGKLAKEFINRIRYYDNPGTHNLKLNNFHVEETPRVADDGENDDSSSMDVETITETANLMKNQMNLPQFCLNTINSIFDYLYVCPEAGDSFRRKKCQIGINTALVLLRDAILLLKMSVKSCIFTMQSVSCVNIQLTLKKFEETFRKYGEVLSHFRIKVVSEDFNDETRMIQLHLLSNFVFLHADFIPDGRGDLLPANLKHALSESLLDAPLGRIFPALHRHLYVLGREFQTDDIYETVTRVCASMTASIRFLREWRSLPFTKIVSLVEESLVSLEFHRNLHLISIFIDLCANKLSTHTFDEDILLQIEDILLKLFSHCDLDIRLAAYRNCHAKVVKTIGAKLNVSKSSAPGSQILFLLSGKILALIAMQGLNDASDEVQSLCEDVLVHVLKAKLLVSEEIWQETVAALMPSMPVLLTHANDKKSLIGRHVLALLDPDRSRMMNFSVVEVLRLNIGLLFVPNAEVRMEAASRLCWLLSSCQQSQAPSSGSGSRKEVRMLPHLNNLHDRVLADVCQIDRKLDFKTYRGAHTHFYQPSSLHQVLDLLAAGNVEPVIRRSAITQISVMMEDPLLHSLFLERNGLELIKNSMRSALTDNDYQDYPDSAIPCLGVLKNLCLYSATVRQEVANNEELLHCILRGVFMFCAEPRVKQDGAVLLFFIVFNEYVRGTPVKNDLCVADILHKALRCPIETKSYSTTKDYALQSLKTLKANKWAFSSLQIHWNIEHFQGLEHLLQPNFTYTIENKSDHFDNELKLTPTDLRAVKSTSIQFTITKCLEHIFQNHSHDIILAHLHLLMRCISLYEITKDGVAIDLDSFEWEKSFARYLNAPPAGQQDNILLSLILDFFSVLLPHLKMQNSNSNANNWIVSLLTSKTHYFNVLLAVELTQEQEQDVEKLLTSLLNLINACVGSEQGLFDLQMSGGNKTSATSMNTNATAATVTTLSLSNKYSHIVKTLVSNLQCTNTKHFYNLAYLDRLLKTLTHLTATFGWSDAKPNDMVKKVMTMLCSCAFELVNAFHCGKGPTAADSFMGLSITRNVVFVLNHLVAEMQHFTVKSWEECFEDAEGGEMGSVFRSIFVLKNSRDVVLRAAALLLLSGMAMSVTCAVQMIHDIAEQRDYLHLWKMSLGVLCDHEESAIVRENAGLLLTNLCSHAEQDGGEMLLVPGILIKTKTQRYEGLLETQKKILLALLDSCCLFSHVEVILKRLHTQKTFNFYQSRSITNSDMDEFMFLYNKVLEVSNISDSLNPNDGAKSAQKFEDTFGITTPGVVKALSTFLYNLVCLLPQSMSRGLQTMGLIKLLFKCVSLSNIDIENERDLISYADLLQMNAAICALLTRTAENNENCFLTIGNARDCLSTLTALLDPGIYVVSLPELHYLRNKLWSSVYNLLDVLLRGVNDSDCTGKRKYDSSALILQLECRKEQFLMSLCESINTEVSNDLQLSALNSLSSLLKCNEQGQGDEEPIEDCENSPEVHSARSSVQIILDNTKTPRMDSTKHCSQSSSKYDILKDIYFGSGRRTRKASLSLSSLQSEDEDPRENRMAGAELCKILLELYENLNLQQASSSSSALLKPGQGKAKTKRKTVILTTLTALLLVSNEAKHYALEHGLVEKLMAQLQTIYVQLSLENVDSLRKVADKKRLIPLLQELESLLGLMMNFLYGNEDVKAEAAHLGLTDLIHKIWIWLTVQKGLQACALKLLCTLTTNCPPAAASLTLTSCTPGSGPRRTPSNTSLLHVFCALVTKEMEMVSRTHNLETLQLCFHVLHNAVMVSECRFIIVKSNFLAAVCKLHPAVTKRQKPWEQVELMWLEFLSAFSAFPEGQSTIGKMQDVFDIIICLCGCPNVANRFDALQCLRNIAFYHGNRSRLLGSDEFLNILSTRLSGAIPEEIAIVVPTMWALAANCQKAKMVFKAARLDARIKDFLRVLYLNNYANVSDEDVEALQYVLGLLSQSS